jgi:hypothetical protein
MTPMISLASPSTRIRRPMADASPPNQRCQYPMSRDDSLGTVGAVVFRGEPAAQSRLDADRVEDAFGNGEARHLLRGREAGDTYAAAGPGANLFERVVLFAKRKVVGWRQLHLGEIEGGRGLPRCDQGVGIAIRQRLQQDAVDHAEHGRIGAHSDADCEKRHGRKHGRTAQSAQHVKEAIVHECQGTNLLPPETDEGWGYQLLRCGAGEVRSFLGGSCDVPLGLVVEIREIGAVDYNLRDRTAADSGNRCRWTRM